jgi:hypothetical protein
VRDTVNVGERRAIAEEVVAMTEIGGTSRTTRDKVPGWEPDHINPNLQRYWDGSAWTSTRRWVAGQWVDESLPDGEPSTGSATDRVAYRDVRLSQRNAAAVQPRAAVTVRPAVGGLFLCSILLIVGSFTPWITVSFAGRSISGSGTDISISHEFLVNGWFTFSAGALLFILACMIVSSGDAFFHSMAVLFSLLSAAFGIYALVRILQSISQALPSTLNAGPLQAVKPDAGVGWGLIVVLIGSAGAVVCAVGGRRG